MSKMVKHAPGPWKKNDLLERSIIYADDGGEVADVFIDGISKKSFERLEANARLIVAAPDMLEALYEILGQTLAWPSIDDPCLDNYSYEMRLALADIENLTRSAIVWEIEQ